VPSRATTARRRRNDLPLQLPRQTGTATLAPRTSAEPNASTLKQHSPLTLQTKTCSRWPKQKSPRPLLPRSRKLRPLPCPSPLYRRSQSRTQHFHKRTRAGLSPSMCGVPASSHHPLPTQDTQRGQAQPLHSHPWSSQLPTRKPQKTHLRNSSHEVAGSHSANLGMALLLFFIHLEKGEDSIVRISKAMINVWQRR
jgi:hypothetical protein